MMKLRTLFCRAVIIVLSLLLLFSLAGCEAGSAEILSPDELCQNSEEEENDSLNYAYKYFDRWDLPTFNKSRIKSVEVLYRDHYYKELDSAYALASLSVDIFISDYYPNIDLTSKEDVTTALIRSYVEAIGDRFSRYRTKEEYDSYSAEMSGNFVGIGVSVTKNDTGSGIIVKSVLDGSPAKDAGIFPEDLIVAIDGTPVSEIGYEAALSRVRGKSGTTLTLTVVRGDEEMSITLTRREIIDESVTYSLTDGIGYIRISSFKANTDEMFEEAIEYMEESGARAIIYDLRSNSGGYLVSVEKMLDRIAPEGTELVSFSEGYGKPYVAKSKETVKLPTVVLINENTASAAELFTAGVRDLSIMGHFEAKIVGKTSYGKGVMQSTYTMIDGSALTLTVAYYNPPLGENYDGEGIVPDRTVESEKSGDTQLDAAYEEILKMID